MLSTSPPHLNLDLSDQFERLREVRASLPTAIAEAYATRSRRDILSTDGRVFLVAADHPARGALAAGGHPTAMGNRYELLSRLVVALSRPGVDGVLGTPDILDDLALLGALDGKVAVSSLNRGGLRGASFEMDDRFTAHTIASTRAAGLDMAKTLVRINLSDAATARTLETVARAVTAAAAARLPILLEPFLSRWSEGRIVNDLSADAVVSSVAIAAGLGADSSHSWLKLPVVPDMARVMEATTLPTLLLGGEGGSGADALFDSWQQALALPGVRGLVVGRTLLFPEDGTVADAVDRAAALVHVGLHVA